MNFCKMIAAHTNEYLPTRERASVGFRRHDSSGTCSGVQLCQPQFPISKRHQLRKRPGVG
jgi:hypothetical protein